MKRHPPLIITVAPVGAELTKKHTPFLPLTPQEILAEALRCEASGARVLHLHVRDKKGRPTCDPHLIRAVIKQIRQKTHLIVQVSTGGAIGDSLKERLATLIRTVEMGSLTMGSVNFGSAVFINSRPIYTALAQKMLRLNIVPEFEIFDLSMLENTLNLKRKLLVNKKIHFNFVLGVPGALSASEANLRLLVERLPPHATWSVAGIGRHQFAMARLAILWGGHVRVGLEDNIYLQPGVLAKGSFELVARAAAMADRVGRKLATPAEARKILGIRR